MARRKKQYISDHDSDTSDGSQSDVDDLDDFKNGGAGSHEDPDERAERLRFTDPYGRKGRNKRKRDGKEEALYGVFHDGGDGDDAARGSRSNKALRRTQAFVPSSTTQSKKNDTNKPTDLDAAVPQPEAMDIPEFLGPVSSFKTEDGEAAANASSGEEEEDGSSDEESSDEDSEEEERKRRIPRKREEEVDVDDENVLSAALSNDGTSGAQRGGIGARSRGGIGSMARAAAATLLPETAAPKPTSASTSDAGTPGASGIGAARSVSGTPEPGTSSTATAAAARERRAFLGSGSGTSTPTGTGMGAFRKAPAPISKDEQKHFNKIAQQGGFGFKMMQKMGWSAGTGLGTSGEGIVTPLDQKQRPKGMGLAYEGFKERTKQSIQEEKRRKGGAEGSDEEEEETSGKKKKGGKGKQKEKQQAEKGPAAWKQPKPRKPKVQHMTYEQILASSSAGPSTSGGVGVIYDLAGNELPSTALSGAAHVHDVPTSDATRIPELRHNLAIIVDITKSDLDNLAKEGKAVEERRRWLMNEDARIAAALAADQERIHRLEIILSATSKVQKTASSLAYDDRTPSEKLQQFSEAFDSLLSTATAEEYESYRLDEVVVAAIAPIMKAAWQEWDPIDEPTAYLDDLKKLRKMLRLQKRDQDSSQENQVDLFGGASTYMAPSRSKSKVDRSMTAFETMLWTMWMPRVRSAINNSWDPAYPLPVISLFSSWRSSGLLPRFISDNILDQLILPKLSKAINDWSPPRKGKEREKGSSLHHIVFPWLELAGERMDEILDEAKRRVRGWLKSWRVRDGVPEGLAAWRDVIQATEWDNLTLQHVVPQLSAHLREKFTVNPRQQELAPLTLVLSWRPLLRPSILSQIIEAEFFPKFLDALYTWLVAPTVNYSQVADWYKWWKQQAFANFDDLPGVERGFAKALDTMNQAMALGEDAKYRLKKPDMRALPPAKPTNVSRQDKTADAARSQKARADTQAEITFRTVVEEIAAENNLIFMPTGRSHEISGMPLFRVSTGIDGKSGVTVYLQGDVVYAQDAASGAWKPISVQEMVDRGKRAGA